MKKSEKCGVMDNKVKKEEAMKLSFIATGSIKINMLPHELVGYIFISKQNHEEYLVDSVHTEYDKNQSDFQLVKRKEFIKCKGISGEYKKIKVSQEELINMYFPSIK